MPWATPPASTTLLTTEMNGLGDSAASVPGTEFDNVAGLYDAARFRLTTGSIGAPPASGAALNVYMVTEMDTVYADGTTAILPSVNQFLGAFVFRPLAAVQNIDIKDPVVIPPCKFKILVVNKLGAALPGTGNTIKMVPFKRGTV